MASESGASETSPPHALEEFLLGLGIAQLSAGYPVDEVTTTLTAVASAYGRPHMTFVTLPNSIVFDDPSTGRARAIAETGASLRMDQAAVVQDLARRATRGHLNLTEGLAELAAIPEMRPRFPAWANLIGYALLSAGLSLVFRVSLWGVLVAGALGLIVGLLLRYSARHPSVSPLVPPVAALICATVVFGFGSVLDQDVQSLRVVAAPLVALIPGAALTRGTLELAAGHVISGAARLVSAVVQLLVLTFGILVGMQVARVSPYDLSDLTDTLLPWWAPWAGVIVYALGQALVYNEPRGAIRVIVLLLLVTLAVQSLATVLISGIFAAGIAAGVALVIAVLIQAGARRAPLPAFVLFQPAFFLIVPGSLGLIGATEAFTAEAGDAQDDALLVTAATVIAITIGMQIGGLVGRILTPAVKSWSERTEAQRPQAAG